MLFRALTIMIPPLALAACSVFSGGASEAESPPVSVEVVRDLVWSPQDWPRPLKADIHRPQNGVQNPGILMVHGGGWEGRSRSDMSGTAERLAREGYVVMNIDHRFAPAYRFPAQLHDLQVAMRWFIDHADEYGVDPRRIGAWGFSSGAHLVSLLALVSSQQSPLNEPYGSPELTPVVVVAGGLPSDFRKFNSGRRLVQLLGGREQEMPEAYREASPVTHVHAQAPPFFLFHGSWDRLVPIEHAEDFRQALSGAGVPVTLHRQWLRGHFLGFVLDGAAVDEALAFLDDRLVRD